MRVVDDHRERLPRVDRLEPARHAGDGLDPAPDRVVADAERARRERRADRVLAVEAPAAAAARSRRSRASRRRTRSRPGSSAREPAAVLVADVDHGAVGLVEQRALRLEVRLHRAVEVEVVLRQVREDEHREPRAREPPLRLRDRGRLHHARAVARVDHLAEEPLQVDRLGRVEPGRPRLAADAPLDVREQAGLPPVGLEDRVQQERGGRLAVRAGDRGDVELAGRVAEEERRGGRHRGANVRHDELRQRDVDGVLDDERGRAERRGRRPRTRARRALAPRTQKKSVPGTTDARVVGELVTDVDRSRVHDLRPRREPR